MSSPPNYSAVAAEYAKGVTELFLPPSIQDLGSDRGGISVAPDELSARAEKLLPISGELTESASARLTDADEAVRADAELKLLAKAATDLEIAELLYKAAENEATSQSVDAATVPDRSMEVDVRSIKDNLSVILRQQAPEKLPMDRTGGANQDLSAIRRQTTTEIEDTIDLIVKRAAKGAQPAIGGLIGLGVSQVAGAIGVFGKNIADMLGAGETLSRWYDLIRAYAVKAYESILALLGSAAQVVSTKVLEWVNQLAGKWTGELKEGKLLEKWLGALYQSEQTKQQLGAVVAKSPAPDEAFSTVMEKAKTLNNLFEQQIKWSGKVLRWMPTLSGLAAVAIPNGTLLVLVMYMALGGYIIVSGADYVDAPGLTFMERVDGIRHVVEDSLT